MNTEKFLSLMLVLHIAGGALSLISGLGAMLTTKGSTIHRTFGKIYFYSMTAVFIGALATAIGHQRDFLLMVAFFSYYLTVRGYRTLFLKKLHLGQKPVLLDGIILIVSGVFILLLIGWGVWALVLGSGMGIVGIAFGSIGLSFLIQDVRHFRTPPKEKMHWWYSHINAMGGSYISAVTAFVVVNIQIGQMNWILWLLPSVIGGTMIGRTVRHYKEKFATKAMA